MTWYLLLNNCLICKFVVIEVSALSCPYHSFCEMKLSLTLLVHENLVLQIKSRQASLIPTKTDVTSWYFQKLEPFSSFKRCISGHNRGYNYASLCILNCEIAPQTSVVSKHIDCCFISVCTASKASNWFLQQSPSLQMKEQDEYVSFHTVLNIQGDQRNSFNTNLIGFFLTSDRVKWMINSSSCCCKVQECQSPNMETPTSWKVP